MCQMPFHRMDVFARGCGRVSQDVTNVCFVSP